MKKIAILTILFAVNSLFAQQNITKLFPLEWKAEIGVTTYRTNMIFHDGSIYIASNGKDRNLTNDEKDGVYKIDAKTGTITHQFKIEYAGDNDITGISIADNKLFFGSDNYTFFCFDLKTSKEVWKIATPYDVESAPVNEDFNQDGTQDVFFTVENNGFYALNGIDGSIIWQRDSVSAHRGNPKALLVDINNDGIKDIVSSMSGTPMSDKIDGFKMAHYGDYHWALDGKTGATLWAIPSGAGIHNSPYLYDYNGQKRLALIDCYGQFHTADLNGTILSFGEFGYGYFCSPVMSNDKHLILGDYSILYDDEHLVFDSISGVHYLSNSTSNSLKLEGRLSATTILADVLGLGYQQAIGVTEEGILFIMKTDGTPLKTLKINKGAEASVFVQDIDGDGKLEILVSELDGKLYCYGTQSKGKIEKGSF